MKTAFRWMFQYRALSLVVLTLVCLAPLAFWATAKNTARAPEPPLPAAAARVAAAAPARAARTAASSAKPAMAAVNITPFLDCVEDHGNGTFTAYFGYESFEAGIVQVLTDTPDNRFSPNPADRGQPVLFFPGLHKSAFRITSSSTMIWSFAGLNVLATSASTPCRPRPSITPFVESVTVNAATSEATATFGYYNGTNRAVSLESSENRLLYGTAPVPGPQPPLSNFLPGLNRNAFTMTFPSNSALTWQVQDIPALAVPGACPNITVRVR